MAELPQDGVLGLRIGMADKERLADGAGIFGRHHHRARRVFRVRHRECRARPGSQGADLRTSAALTAGEKLTLQLTPTASIKHATMGLWKARDLSDGLYTVSVGVATRISERLQLSVDLLDTFKNRWRTAATKKNDIADRCGFAAEEIVVGANFNPEIGFVLRHDFARTYALARFSPRPKRSRLVRKYT